MENLSPSKNQACWSCGKETSQGDFFCPACGKIQSPPKAWNAFKLFNIPCAITLEEKALEEAYLALQIKVHPDKFMQKEEQEKRYAQEYASVLNQAYSILSSEETRALHFLEVQGLTSDELKKYKVPASIISQQFELQERLENGESIHEIQAEITASIHACVESLIHAINQELLEEACQKAVELRFLKNFEKSIREDATLVLQE